MKLQSIKKIFWEAFGYLYHYKNELVKALLAPFIILFFVGWIEPEKISPLLSMLIALAALVAYLFLIVTTHRVILLGPNSVPRWGIYKITKREVRFALYSFVIIIVAMLPSVILVFIPVVGGIAFILGFSYLISRFSLVLPSIAIDQDLSFSDSWKVTKNYQLLMFVVVGIFPILLNILISLISFIPYTSLAVTVLSLLITVWTVAALSVAFQIIVEAEYKENESPK